MVKRRKVLIGAAVAGGAAAVGAGARSAGAASDHETLLVDKVVRTTCSPNCTGSCGQLAFVRDGRVVKIQQAADYPDKAYNPRGCMKGLSYLQQIHGDDRIMTPLIRTGERGSGEFREATWDEALDKVATAASLSTQKNSTLKPIVPAPAIPERVGTGKPTLP